MNTLEFFIADIKKALDNDCYFSALALALTLPDICGRIKYPDEKSVSKRYKKWFHEYVWNGQSENNQIKFDENICYKLRCSLLHEGNNKLDSKKNKIKGFALVIEPKNIYDLYVDSARITRDENNQINGRYINVQVRNICKLIINGVENMYKNEKLNYEALNYLKVIDNSNQFDDYLKYVFFNKRAFLEKMDNYVPIYKYFSVDIGIKAIKNHCIVLNHPQNFNDPFDSVINISDEEEKKCYDLLCDFYTLNEIKKIAFQYEVTSQFPKSKFNNFKEIYRKYRETVKESKVFESNQLLNSITKQFTKYVKREQINKIKNILSVEIIKKIKEVKKNALISCFSKNNDSILMWSHYAKNHTGICIEYEKPLNDMYDVSYEDSLNSFELYNLVQRCLADSLMKNDTDINDKTLLDIATKPFITKSKVWEYENELRYITSYKNIDEHDVVEKDNIIYMFIPTKIRKVYLGCNISEGNELVIKELCNEYNIECYKFKINKDSYSLIAEKLNK